MGRYRLDLAYLGDAFFGWQSQPGGSGVQDQIEDAIFKITGERIRVIASSRTDTGVHCEHQIASFVLQDDFDCRKLALGMQSTLPKSIGIKSLETVDASFHPQREAVAKLYRYKIWNHAFRDPFLTPFSWHMPQKLDLERLQREARSFIGNHNFKSFCAADSHAKTHVRPVYDIEVVIKGAAIEVWVLGGGFLKQMIRIMVGTLVDIARGQLAASSISKILAAQDRMAAGYTAPGQGLTLVRIFSERPEDLKSLVRDRDASEVSKADDAGMRV